MYFHYCAMLSYLDHLLLHSKHNFRDLLRTLDTVQEKFSEIQHYNLFHPLWDLQISWIEFVYFWKHTVFPRIVSAETILFWLWPYVLWPLVTVHKSAETIRGNTVYVLQDNTFSHAFVEDQMISTKDFFRSYAWSVKFFSWF